MVNGINVIDGLTWIDALRKNEGSVIQTGNEAKIIFGKKNISELEQSELNKLAATLNSKNVQNFHSGRLRAGVEHYSNTN